MAQHMWMPYRDAGPLARLADRLTIGPVVVELAVRPPRVRLWSPRRLRGRHGRVPPGPLLGPPLGHRPPRAEQVAAHVERQERPQQRLGPGAKEDESLAVVVLTLMSARAVDPAGRVAHVDVDGPHQHDLARPHPGQPLEADHGGYRSRQVRQGALHGLVADRPDWRL